MAIDSKKMKELGAHNAKLMAAEFMAKVDSGVYGLDLDTTHPPRPPCAGCGASWRPGNGHDQRWVCIHEPACPAMPASALGLWREIEVECRPAPEVSRET